MTPDDSNSDTTRCVGEASVAQSMHSANTIGHEATDRSQTQKSRTQPDADAQAESGQHA